MWPELAVWWVGSYIRAVSPRAEGDVSGRLRYVVAQAVYPDGVTTYWGMLVTEALRGEQVRHVGPRHHVPGVVPVAGVRCVVTWSAYAPGRVTTYWRGVHVAARVVW